MPNIKIPDFDSDEPSVVEDDLDESFQAQMTNLRDLGTIFVPAGQHGLPSPIVVGERPYEVFVFTPGLDPRWHSRRWDGLRGQITEDDPKIWVGRDLTPEERRETLLHEVLHAVDAAAATEAGEAVVVAWAPILLDALRKNPELLAMLLAEDQA